MTDIKKLAIIDADFLIYNVGFSCEDSTEREAKNRLTEWLTDIVYMRLECDDYKAFLTGKNNFRYDIAKTVPYKGNRKDAVKPKHFDALRNHLGKLGAVTVDGSEADDACAIALVESPMAVLVHVDKDLNQLAGKHYNPVKDIEYEVTEIEGLYNFYTQMLTGDRTDNIPGLPKIGPVKAVKILNGLEDEASMYKAVKDKYTELGFDDEYLLEQARLLWLQRYEGELWQPPKDVNESL